jgi:hypothetical protein
MNTVDRSQGQLTVHLNGAVDVRPMWVCIHSRQSVLGLVNSGAFTPLLNAQIEGTKKKG